MKKLMAGAMMIFGTMFLTAQTTPQQDTAKTGKEKKLNKANAKTPETVEPNGMNRSVDTTKLNQQKIENERARDQMNQRRDGINDEATKPMQPAPGKTE
ncbi:hypothetical protein [Epilithonimonas sp.]|jgi:hypothetical protein|uniref:hypothetical protein n=1 Tax=Epilithonimonas sp. TaxID=2894511 RepID=UPI0035AE9A44